MTPPTKTVAVALSVEALMHQWARQSQAPAGAAVIAETEIAARRRGGIEWRTPDAVSVSVLARPDSLDAATADVAWAASSLAAAQALEDCRGGRRGCLWPDTVSVEPSEGLEVAVGAACTLGPGRVEFAVLTVRVGPMASPEERSHMADALLSNLRRLAARLDDPATIFDEYRARCSTIGHAVEVQLLPQGTMRGLATDVDDSARLVLTSPTGLREQITVGALNQVVLLQQGDSD